MAQPPKKPRRTAERILEDTLELFNRFGEPNGSTTLISAEMGISPGNMVFHSHSMKLMNGIGDLPRYILDYTEKNYAKYLEAPKEWLGPVMTSSFGEFKKKIDAKKKP